MPLFGTIAVWTALAAVALSMCLYLFGGPRAVRWGRAAFVLAAGGVFAAAAALGVLLVTHRFDVAYVYQHSARATAPLYWFPSFWTGQEGSFLLWAFWVSVLGLVLAATSHQAERRVMPVYSALLLFLTVMLAARSPFIMLDTQGQPVPTEGLGLNPNLENPWVVIHPPTLFLGFSALAVPFAFALSGLLWRDGGWLRRALPWGLFGFSVLGLAMMMGGYWAYEMLGWGGFWGWDPVENGPFVPWIALVAFLHAAQIERVRGSFQKPTLCLALLPFIGAMYESFLTRSGILANFSVHSFTAADGLSNALLLGGLLLALVISAGALLWRAREVKRTEDTTNALTSREFGYTLAIGLLLVVGAIACVGMSAPLLTGWAVKLGWMAHTASVKEDFYNRAMFPLAVLTAVGLGMGPWLTWRGAGKVDSSRLGLLYLLSVLAAVGFVLAERHFGTPLSGARLVPELLLFTASVFALLANGALLVQRAGPQPIPGGKPPVPSLSGKGRKNAFVLMHAHLNFYPSLAGRGRSLATGGRSSFGGLVSHIGAALLLLGLVGLVTFTHKETYDLAKHLPQSILDGRYLLTYDGQTGNFLIDHNNALQFTISDMNRHHPKVVRLPFAQRDMGGGDLEMLSHPAIVHQFASDVYLSIANGTGMSYFFVRGRADQSLAVAQPKTINPQMLGIGDPGQFGDYTITLVKLRRDPRAAAYVAAYHQMPPAFPVWADLAVTYKGKSYFVQPVNVTYANRNQPATAPEIALPGGMLLSLEGMSAGGMGGSNDNAANEGVTIALRQPGPVLEAFQIDVSTRPLINFVWLGTLLVFFGGMLSMRRRILENREEPIEDSGQDVFVGKEAQGGARRNRAKRRMPSAKPAPSLAVPRGKG